MSAGNGLQDKLLSFFGKTERMAEEARQEELAQAKTLFDLEVVILESPDDKLVRMAENKAFHMIEDITADNVPEWFQRFLEEPATIPHRFSNHVVHKAEQLLSEISRSS